jgi:hypothetical protein
MLMLPQCQRYLEMYLLWLFGWVMLHPQQQCRQDSLPIRGGDRQCGGGIGAEVELGIDGPSRDLPSLCQACTKTAPDAVLTGCQLLLQL